MDYILINEIKKLRIKTNLTQTEFYETIKKPYDNTCFLPLCARVWIHGLEYEIEGVSYFLPLNDDSVWRTPTLKEVRKLKLNKING